MKVKCISDKMDVFGDNFPKGYNKNQYVGLILGKGYIVMGIIKTESGMKYLIGEEKMPIYFWHEIFFTVIDNRISFDQYGSHWYFISSGKGFLVDKIQTNAEYLIGYEQLCLDEKHYHGIFEREEKDLKIFYEELNKIRSFYEDRNFALKI